MLPCFIIVWLLTIFAVAFSLWDRISVLFKFICINSVLQEEVSILINDNFIYIVVCYCERTQNFYIPFVLLWLFEIGQKKFARSGSSSTYSFSNQCSFFWFLCLIGSELLVVLLIFFVQFQWNMWRHLPNSKQFLAIEPFKKICWRSKGWHIIPYWFPQMKMKDRNGGCMAKASFHWSPPA